MKVSENFKQVGIVKLDSKKRITLGALIKKFSILTNNPIDDFETYIGDNGDILLKPRTAIPTMELWVHQNPDILNDINRGIKDINDGKTTKVKDIEDFLDKL
ncbi:hypothetical protein J7L48_00815 [bacterium]|nr:hypothetical protein [bacterium]